jgi:hypothetical protein
LVLHLLSEAQKVKLVELSLSLLWMLEVQEQRAWHEVATLDESWFYCSTDHAMQKIDDCHCLESQPISLDTRSSK